MKKILALSLLILLVGCTSTPEKLETDTTIFNLHRGDVERFVDDEAGVICYVWATWGSSRGSMDCIPVSDTRLDFQGGNK